jgi:hypothetical protein
MTSRHTAIRSGSGKSSVENRTGANSLIAEIIGWCRIPRSIQGRASYTLTIDATNTRAHPHHDSFDLFVSSMVTVAAVQDRSHRLMQRLILGSGKSPSTQRPCFPVGKVTLFCYLILAGPKDLHQEKEKSDDTKWLAMVSEMPGHLLCWKS